MGSSLVVIGKHREMQCTCVHHSTLEEFIILCPALVEGEEENDERAEETHCSFKHGAEKNTVYVHVCVCVCACVCVCMCVCVHVCEGREEKSKRNFCVVGTRTHT